MGEIRFEKKHGSYYCMRGTHICWMADAVGIVFDRDAGTLLKIGPVEVARKYAQFVRSSALGQLLSVCVLESDRFEVWDLERVLSTSGYVKELERKLMSDI